MIRRTTVGAIALVALAAVLLWDAWPALKSPEQCVGKSRERNAGEEPAEHIAQESYRTAKPKDSIQKISGKIGNAPESEDESPSSKGAEVVADAAGAITQSSVSPSRERTSVASRFVGTAERLEEPSGEAVFLGPAQWMAGTPPDLERAVLRELERPLPANGPDGLVLAARALAMEDIQKRARACHRDASVQVAGMHGRIALAGDLVGSGAMAQLGRVSIIAQTGLDSVMFQECLLREAAKVHVPYRGHTSFELAWELPLTLP